RLEVGEVVRVMDNAHHIRLAEADDQGATRREVLERVRQGRHQERARSLARNPRRVSTSLALMREGVPSSRILLDAGSAVVAVLAGSLWDNRMSGRCFPR